MIVAADRPDAVAPRTQSETTGEGDDVFATLVRRQPTNEPREKASSPAGKIGRPDGKTPSTASNFGTGPATGTQKLRDTKPDTDTTQLGDETVATVEIAIDDDADLFAPAAGTQPVLIEAVKVENGFYTAVQSLEPDDRQDESAAVAPPVIEVTDEPLPEEPVSRQSGAALPVIVGYQDMGAARPRRLQRAAEIVDLVQSMANSQLPQGQPRGQGPDTANLMVLRQAPDTPGQIRQEGAEPGRLRFAEILTSVRSGGPDTPVVPTNLGKATFDAATQAVLQSNVERRDQVAPSVGEIMLRADVAAIMGHAGPSGGAGTVSTMQGATPLAPSDALITTRAEDMIRDLGYGIARDFKAGSRWLDIRLDPGELGRIDVRLAVDPKGHVQAVIAADNPATYDLLRREGAALVRALQQAGVETDSGALQFELRSDLGRDGHRQAWTPQDRADEEPSPSNGTPEVKLAGRVRGHLI